MTSADVNEFRRQLNEANSKIERLSKQVTQHESEAISYRKELNEIMDDRDRSQNSLDVKNIITQRKLSRSNKKIKDLELQMEIQAIKIEKLNYDLMVSLMKETELTSQVAVWENKSRVENDKFETCKAKLMSDLQASQLNEINLRSQVKELQSEIRLQITGLHLKAANAVVHSEVQNELKEALQQNSENNRELSDLRTECHKLKTNLKTIELKYSNEVQLHASDLQALTLCKDKLGNATEKLKAALLKNESIEKQANEFEERLVNLTDHNTALYELFQDHNTKVMSENIAANKDSIFSRTLTDDEINKLSSPKLFSVIKYLRREKDISAANIEVLKTQNIRLVCEYDMQKIQLNELIQQQVTADKSSVNEANDLPTKCDELKRNEAIVNAITDSNIRLANERDALLINVKDLTERVKKAEGEFVVLQEKHLVLATKAEKLQSESTKRTLKMAEESQQLQNERDNLRKMLTTEKVRLSEKVNLLESEKLRLEQDVAAANKKLNAAIDEKKKIQNEFDSLQITSLRLTEELTEVKSKIAKNNCQSKVIRKGLASKYAELKKIKETQMRTYAKKYKNSYFDLKAKIDARKARLATQRLGVQIETSTSTSFVETEETPAKKRDNLSSHLVLGQNVEHNTFDDSGASISQLNDDKTFSVKSASADETDANIGTKHNEIQIEESRETMISSDDAQTGRKRSRRIRKEIGWSTQQHASPQQGARRPIVRAKSETVTSTSRS